MPTHIDSLPPALINYLLRGPGVVPARQQGADCRWKGGVRGGAQGPFRGQLMLRVGRQGPEDHL